MSNGGNVTRGGRRLRANRLLRAAAEEFTYNGEYGFFKLSVRGKVRQTAEYASDPDNSLFRARRSKGWKSRKHRFQWEHNYIAAEKHEKNRREKAEKIR